jgi:apolipoprotein N-acyltransferase
MDIRKSALDDPAYANFAWDRYKRLMKWMAFASFLAALAGLYWIHVQVPDATIHMYVATALGISFSVLLAAALMGLVFLSAGSGHDECIDDPFKDEK